MKYVGNRALGLGLAIFTTDDVNIMWKYKTSVNMSCRYRKYFFLSIFLLNCSAINATSHKEACPFSDSELRNAACQGDFAKITEIVGSRGCALDSRDKYGHTSLMCAAAKGHINIVIKLLEGRSKVDLRDEHGTTALMIASANGREKIVSVLLKNGADPNLVDSQGWTSLMYAAGFVHPDHPMNAYIGRVNATRILIKAGADVSLKNNNGKNALFMAEQNNQTEIIKLLREAGAKSLHNIDQGG